MRTTADEKIDEAKEAIDKAVESLASVVVHKCMGYKDYTEIYKARFRRAFNKLIEIREELDN